MQAIRSHPLVAFFVLAFVIAWAFVPFGSFGAFAPLVAALIVVPVSRGRAGLLELGRRVLRWRVRWYWWALAVLVPLAVHVIAVVVTGPPADSPFATASVGTVVLLFLLRLVNPLDGPLGEEPGWRGVALPGMAARLSPLAATSVLAVLITVWHLPLAFLGGGDPASTVVFIVVGTVGVTFWYSWLFAHAGGSVLLCLVAHGVEGAINNDTLVYVSVWLVVAVLLVVVDRRWWRGPAPTAARTPDPPLTGGGLAPR
jgi:membrane protease YdiL (CAAX protease family)